MGKKHVHRHCRGYHNLKIYGLGLLVWWYQFHVKKMYQYFVKSLCFVSSSCHKTLDRSQVVVWCMHWCELNC